MHIAIMYGAEGNWYYYEAGEKDTVVYLIMRCWAASARLL